MNTKSKLYKVTIAFMAVVILFAIFNPFSERIKVNADTVPDVEVTSGTLMSTRTETNSHTRRYNVGDEAGIYGMCASANLASPSGHTGSATTISSSTYSGTINVGGTNFSKWEVLQTAVWYLRNSGSTKNLVWEYLHKYVSLIISGQDYTPDCIYNEQQACLNTLKGLINAHGDAGYSVYVWKCTDGSNCQTLLLSGKPTVNTPPETPPETPPTIDFMTTAAVAATRKYVSVDGTEYPGKGATFTVYEDAACTNSIGTMTENEMSDHEVYYSTFVTGFGMAEVSPNVDKSEHIVTLYFKETSPATKAYMNGSWQDVTCKQDSTVYFIEYTWIYGAEGGPSLRYESGKVVNNRLSVLRNGTLKSNGTNWGLYNSGADAALAAVKASSWKDWLVSEQGVGFFGYTTNSKSIINVESLDCYGSLELTKLDQNGLASRGATFTIYSNEACTTPVGTFTDASNNGVYVSPKLTIGTGFTASTPTVARNYYFKETTAATQHLVNGNWINADFARDTSTYCLYLVYYPSSNTLHYSIQNLTTGSMLVTDKVITSYDISGIDSQRCKYNFTNIVSVASMAGNKIVVNTTDFTNNNLSGFAFELLSGNTVVATGITDSNGNVIWTSSIYTISSDRRVITNLPFGTYTYRETTPIDHYYSYNGTSTTIPYTYTMTNPWALGPTGFYERVITLTTANTLEAALTTNIYTTQNVIGRASISVTKNLFDSYLLFERSFNFNIYYLGNGETPEARNLELMLPVEITLTPNDKSQTVTVYDLPIGWYEIEEVSEEGYKVFWVSDTICHVEDGDTYFFICDNYKPQIGTELTDMVTMSHQVRLGEDITLKDTVFYDDLIPGETYLVKGVLMDKSTGTELTDKDGNVIMSEAEFVAEEASGSVEVLFNVDTTVFEPGFEIVAFETLYYEGYELCIHADIEDLGQTVVVPSIGTVLTDKATGTHQVSYGEDVILTDEISYVGLIPGTLYTVKGVLWDKGTETSLEIYSEASFVPSEPSGKINVEFTLNSCELSGKTLVAFETIYLNGSVIAEHKDFEDEGQTVYAALLSTSAEDLVTGSHYVTVGETTEFKDVVTYSNLPAGCECQLVSTLIDKTTGDPLTDVDGNPYEISSTFVPDRTEGSYEAFFNVDGALLSGKTVVIYEELLFGDVTIAVHKDIEDENQTLYIPYLLTEATVGGEKVFETGDNIVLTDSCLFDNLENGEDFVMEGTVMLYDGENSSVLVVDGKEVTSETAFTYDGETNSCDVVFEFDTEKLSEYENSKLVVYETLYKVKDNKRSVVLEHKDINNLKQTVEFKAVMPESSPQVPATGENLNLIRIGEGASIIGVGVCLYQLYVVKKKDDDQ